MRAAFEDMQLAAQDDVHRFALALLSDDVSVGGDAQLADDFGDLFQLLRPERREERHAPQALQLGRKGALRAGPPADEIRQKGACAQGSADGDDESSEIQCGRLPELL